MLGKKGGGFVLLVLALFVFSGLFVSGYSFTSGGVLYNCASTSVCTSSTTDISTATTIYGHNQFVSYSQNSGWNVAKTSYTYNLTYPMNANGISFTIGSVNSQVCNIDIASVNDQGTSSTIVSNFRVNYVSPKVIAYSFTSKNIKSVVISSSSCNIYAVLNLYGLSVFGEYYTLSLVNKNLDSFPILALNSQINSSVNGLETINGTYTYSISSAPSCVVDVYTVSGNSMKKVDTFNLQNSGINREITRSFSITNPTHDNKIVFSSAKSGSNYCFRNVLNLINVAVSGKDVTPAVPCTSFTYSDWTSCQNGMQTHTQISSLPSGCIGGSPVLTQSCGGTNCSVKCGNLNVTNLISLPNIHQFSAISPRVNQEVKVNSQGNSYNGYEFWWTYNFLNGGSLDFCSCNSSITNKVDFTDTVLYSGSTSGMYSFGYNLTNQFGKMLKNVTLRVAARTEANISSWVNSTMSVNYPSYCPSTPICNVTGTNTFSLGNRNSFYRTCIEQSNGCYNWSSDVSCPDGYLFNLSSSSCNVPIVSSCNAYDNNPTFCFNGVTIPFGSHNYTSGSCGTDWQTCVVCNTSRTWNSVVNECISSSCTFNCTSDSGGLCLNQTAGNFLLNATNSPLYECCSSKSCYRCNSGFHFFNNTCVSNSCTNNTRLYPVGLNFTVGVNTTNSSSVIMEWNYFNGPISACQWNCSTGYELNLSTNNTCQEIVRVNCTQNLTGVCSNVSVDFAENKSLNGYCASASESCYVCGLNYKLVGNRCELKSCEDKGQINNGIGCVENISCSSGCIIENKNGEARCVARGFKFNKRVNNTQQSWYCDYDTGVFKSLLANNAVCSYPAQCSSNLCVNNTCYDVKSQIGIIKNFLISITCFFENNRFTTLSNDYATCVSNKQAQAANSGGQ